MINKDTEIYCSFSSNPGNNGCNFFNKEFQKHGTNAIYKSFYSDDIKKSIEAVKSLDIKGFALSMPFKVEALDYVDEIEDSAKKIGSINTVINKGGYLKGYNTDWIAVKKYFEVREFKSIYIIGNGGFSKAVQYVCDIMNIQFEIITRDNWELIGKLNNQTLFNATPIYIKTDNHLIDARPTEIIGKTIAKYQAEEQLKIYVGVVSG